MSSVARSVSAIVSVAASFNLSVTTYEAGQSLVESAVIEWGNSPTPALTNLFIGTNRDPRMQELYTLYINSLIRVGVVSAGQPLMHFSSTGTYTQYGSWGLFEFTGQPIATAPKYLALVPYFHIAENSPVCISPSQLSSVVSSFGISDTSFTGYPAVLKPSPGDVWVSGQTVEIAWNGSGVPVNSTITINLRHGAYCSNSAGSLIQTLASKVRQSLSIYTLIVPHLLSYAGDASYFVEIHSSQAGSNYSNFFSIVPTAYEFSNISLHCCYGSLYPTFTDCVDLLPSNPFYAVESAWATTTTYCRPVQNLSTSSCTVDPNSGCREYRTAAHGKPFSDCVAQTSAYPGYTPVSVESSAGSLSWTPLGIIQEAPASCYAGFSLESCVAGAGSIDSACSLFSPSPTLKPTHAPTRPTRAPTRPTSTPTLHHNPTKVPTPRPTVRPTPKTVTAFPTARRTTAPTARPSVHPTYRRPTFFPTA